MPEQLPRRPTPESFHETIQDQFAFNQYENEALTETEPPVYIPKTTYKYENDYKDPPSVHHRLQRSRTP